ncbi:MAG: hypothetical protein V3574_01760 [Candidatus Moraniibacteriota bacterium]
MTKQVQKHKIYIPDSVIDGFCYPFAKTLLLKLKALEKEDRIFDKKSLENMSEGYFRLTKIADCVSMSLSTQIGFENNITQCRPEEFQEFIETAEEFLAIFEIK